VDLLGEPDSGLDAATRKLSVRVRRLANHVERELRRELAAEGIEVWELEGPAVDEHPYEPCLAPTQKR
jgi:ketopantoate reductase